MCEDFMTICRGGAQAHLRAMIKMMQIGFLRID
jgi:hypothetical protein